MISPDARVSIVMSWLPNTPDPSGREMSKGRRPGFSLTICAMLSRVAYSVDTRARLSSVGVEHLITTPESALPAFEARIVVFFANLYVVRRNRGSLRRSSGSIDCHESFVA